VTFLLKLSGAIDRLGIGLGHAVRWLILGSVLISASNAVMRKAFDIGSNAFLEVQWYLFAAAFLLGAGYTFLRNAHVRIDFLSSRLSERAAAWVDILGIVLVVLPFAALMILWSWPLFARAWTSGEMSQNAGGLVLWPARLVIPIGFALLLLQALSELVKRAAFLRGLLPHPITPEAKPESDPPAGDVRAEAQA
jgi:TRAP-type mannitol/chloroaromatic compound transport system permease small subunit